ncbi:MAG: hypothetical protein ABIX01_04585 [Chitinophagaceae bacterium]
MEKSISNPGRGLLNKVPEVTIFFWIIKILCTTVGETAADFLNVNLNFGLTGTSIVTGILLLIALVIQFRSKRYVPGIYWFTVALVSVFGTLVTDNLTDRIGIPLEVSTIIFTCLLALTFLVWYFKEKTLSVHSIYTTRREMFYWLAILFTFALGTASGDLLAEGLALGYLTTGIIVAAIIFITVIAWKLRLNSVLSFWIIYIMTRPLGASIGDYLSQSTAHGGLGLGVTVTSAIFIAGILGIVIYLSITKRDVIVAKTTTYTDESKEKGGLLQTIIAVAILLTLGITGYRIQKAKLQANIAPANNISPTNPAGNQPNSPLGDLSTFKTIVQNTLDKLNQGDQAGATTRIGDLEYEWDNAQARLKAQDKNAWTEIDKKIDTVLRELRAVTPKISTEKSSLETLLAALK